MPTKNQSNILLLRIVSIFALVVACGILLAVVMGKSEQGIAPIALMLLVAGLALSVVASAKAKAAPREE